MKITQIETHLVSAPLSHSWETGIGSAKRRDELLVFVHTDEGITGLGSSYHAHAALAVKAAVDTKVAPALIGANPLDIGIIWEKLFYGTVYIGSAGVQALAGIDIALWDILGKLTGQPVARLLGGGGVETVTAYVGCMSLGFKDEGELVEEAQHYVSQGYRALKIRGGAGVRQDMRAMHAVRNAVGDAIDLMIDVNARYSWPEALDLSRRLQEVNTFWLEDPFDFSIPNHHDDVGKLRSFGLTPLASGGNVYSRFDYRNLLERGGVDFLTPDVVKSGGFSESLKMAHMASAYDCIVAPHTLNGLGQVANVHFAAAIPGHVRGHVEWDPTSPNPLRDELLSNPVRVENGLLHVPQGPGLGTDINPDALKRLRSDGSWEIDMQIRKRRWNT
jgi:L-alanine-DL-glutamate epimerase-like enolase superfamily enzyme